MAELRIEIPRIELGHLELTLIGDSPLISHRWSDKAKGMMLAKQMKKAKPGKEAKDPDQDYRESLYEHPEGGFGFPCVAFKAASVGACRFSDGIKMTEARGAFHVVGELAKIEGDPSMREDMVRIDYNRAALSAEQIVNLFNIAGFGVGVGEWRPEKDGSYGRFHVATQKDVP